MLCEISNTYQGRCLFGGNNGYKKEDGESVGFKVKAVITFALLRVVRKAMQTSQKLSSTSNESR